MFKNLKKKVTDVKTHIGGDAAITSSNPLLSSDAANQPLFSDVTLTSLSTENENIPFLPVKVASVSYQCIILNQ